MKIPKLILLPFLALSLASASAAVITRFQTFTENAVLNDGTGLGNEFDQATTLFSDIPGVTLSGLSVGLDIAGGFNGQLYAYLSHGAGFSVLLNRVGRDAANPGGFIDPGLHVTLADSAANGDMHIYTPNNQATPLTGTWAPDGRETDPLNTVTGNARTAMLSSFLGQSADGVWTLYVEDVVSGQQATLNSWTLNLEVDTVPEPGTLALSAVVLCGVAGYAARRYRRRAA